MNNTKLWVSALLPTIQNSILKDLKCFSKYILIFPNFINSTFSPYILITLLSFLKEDFLTSSDLLSGQAGIIWRAYKLLVKIGNSCFLRDVFIAFSKQWCSNWSIISDSIKSIDNYNVLINQSKFRRTSNVINYSIILKLMNKTFI